jgi:hypothetical protein
VTKTDEELELRQTAVAAMRDWLQHVSTVRGWNDQTPQHEVVFAVTTMMNEVLGQS